MSRRFQFSLRAMVGFCSCLAVFCAFLRLAFDERAWMPALLWPVIYAIGFASAGSALGLLVNRPFRGVIAGLLAFFAYWGAIVWFVWTY